MLKRKATDAIKNWVNSKERKCLVVQGARQTAMRFRFPEKKIIPGKSSNRLVVNTVSRSFWSI